MVLGRASTCVGSPDATGIFSEFQPSPRRRAPASEAAPRLQVAPPFAGLLRGRTAGVYPVT